MSGVTLDKQLNVNWKKLLDCALGIGIRLLHNGAEISRVEETVSKICYAYGAAQVDVFAIPTKIEATLETNDDWFTTKMRRIYDSSLNLGKIEELNQLSRYICENLPDTTYIYSEIKKFDNNQTSKKEIILKCAAAFIGCGAFSIFYGGSALDGLSAGLVSVVLEMLILFFSRLGHYKIFNTLVFSTVGGFLSVALHYLHIGDHISYIMIGVIMLLIPGKEFGIAFRELMMQDLVSGAYRLFQSIILALAIVIGFSIPIAIFNYDMDFYKYHNWAITTIFGSIGCIMFSILFGTKLKRLPYIIIGSFIVTLLYVMLDKYTNSVLMTIFISQVVGALYAELVSKVVKMPTIVCLLSTNLALVPGGLLYYTVYALWNNKDGGKGYFVDVLSSSLAIGAGILIVSIIMGVIYKYVDILNNKKKNGSAL